MKHKKHTKLTHPNIGHFGRNEWAIIGTTCADIQVLTQKIVLALPEFKVAYLDASHGATEDHSNLAFLTYTQKSGLHHFSTQGDLTKWQIRPYFNEADLLLINGNHFQGQRQIVVIDTKKEISMSKKLERLTDVGLVLLKIKIGFMISWQKRWQGFLFLTMTIFKGLFDFCASK